MEVTKLKKKINSINNWFKKNTKKEEKIFRQGLLAFSIFIICNKDRNKCNKLNIKVDDKVICV